MIIKVIGGEVIHNGEIIKNGGVINDINPKDAEKLCECGLCEMLNGEGIGEEIDEAEVVEEEKDLDEMTKAELLEYAESVGVEVDARANKASIIETLKEADTLDTSMPQ